MAIRKIIQYPEPLLRLKAKKVETFDDELKVLVADMAETMWNAPGVGLAAPQVAESVRVIVVDVSAPDAEEKTHMALINPEIIEHEGTQFDEEGCLSVPELTAQVERYKKVTVAYRTEDGTERRLTTEDRFAVVLQHEIDHLNGVLFIDRLSPLKRNLYKKKRRKMLEMEQHG
jgi:peptide deformylase